MPLWPRLCALSAVAVISGLIQPPSADAHGVESSLRYLDGQLELTSSFSTGEPVEGAVVRLLQADGSAGEELGTIDADGRLQLQLPVVEDGLVDLQVDGGPGHRDYLTLPLQRGVVNLDEVVEGPQPLPWIAWLSAPALVGLVCTIAKVRGHDRHH